MILLEDYFEAQVDPLAPYLLDLIRDIMRESGASLHLLCSQYSECEIVEDSGFIFWIDKFGFNVMGLLKNRSETEKQAQFQEFRFPFSDEITRVEHARAIINETILALVLGQAENHGKEKMVFGVFSGRRGGNN